MNRVQQAKDPRFTLMQGDRIHPDNHGNMLMAYFFLKSQGLAGKPVAKVDIDASRRVVLANENCFVNELKVSDKGTVSFTYLAKSLPYPMDTISRGWEKNIRNMRRPYTLRLWRILIKRYCGWMD